MADVNPPVDYVLIGKIVNNNRASCSVTPGNLPNSELCDCVPTTKGDKYRCQGKLIEPNVTVRKDKTEFSSVKIIKNDSELNKLFVHSLNDSILINIKDLIFLSKNDFENDWITEFYKHLDDYGADNVDLNKDEINKLYSEHLEYYEYMKNL